MSRRASRKGSRKNMNLTRQVFRNLEKIKTAREVSIKTTISWDTFFTLLLEDVERMGKAQA